MTRDDIIRMAREARLVPKWLELCPKDEDALVRFAALVAAAEREACAQLCDQMTDLEYGWKLNLPSDCGAAIRARSKK